MAKRKKAQPNRAGDRRPVIVLTTDEHKVTDQAVAALATDKEVFQRNRELVRIVKSDKPDGYELRIEPVEGATLSETLTKAALFVKEKNGILKPDHPPDRLLMAVKGRRGKWPGIRPLAGITSAPVLRPDGSIVSRKGYDQTTGLFYDPQGVQFKIPKRPTREDALAALNRLLDLVSDFRFAEDADRSAWLAAVLTPTMRMAVDEPVPLFAFDGTCPGVGKTLLADLISLIHTGGRFPRGTDPKSDGEWRKKITSLVKAGRTITLIDNVSGPLGSAALDAAVTSTSWEDRLLQTNSIPVIPQKLTLIATGNNLEIRGDTIRRICYLKLESREERPELREEFRYPDLPDHVKRIRPSLLADILTIHNAYAIAGRPQQKLSAFGSFEGWSQLVRAPIVWLGEPDPRETQARVVDHTADMLNRLAAGFDELNLNRKGGTAATVLKSLADSPGRYEGLRNAVFQLCKLQDQEELPEAGLLGKNLRSHLGRVVNGRALVTLKKTREGVQMWAFRQSP